MEVGLVSCTKSKRETAAAPQELYMASAFFRKAREYVETNHDTWYVLSAKHGVLEPDGDPIEPYDETLSEAPVSRKRSWAESVFEELRERGLFADGNRLVFHAGRDYYDELLPLLEETAVETATPTDGLQFGETLSWYNNRSEPTDL
ncbi:DUF6884 domain-containing protein [Halosimplex halobium]|uniref:DUF6884 domain-containing protein n=1 Tax=Halosimplex halobium TaxID=3396618 RepID=UPI003F555810